MRVNLNGSNPKDPFNHKKKKTDSSEEIQLKLREDRPRRSKIKGTEKTPEILDKLNNELNLTKESLKKEDKEEKEINPKIKLAVKIIFPILIIISLLIIFNKPIKDFIIAVENDNYIDKNYVMMPSITGKEESEALFTLEEAGIKYKVVYMYNKYFDNGTVIKSSVDPSNPVKNGSEIIVYVCKDNSLQEVIEGVDFFESIELPDCPETRRTITLIDVELDDIYVNLKFQNNAKGPISSIKYSLGFFDENGNKLTNREEVISDMKLLPGEAVTDRIKLTNPNIKKITFETATYLKYEE